MAKKKLFRITQSVRNASGWQAWTVRANTEHEALLLHKKGKSEFEDQEVEVTALDEPETEEIQE